jgi:hypothetical protein
MRVAASVLALSLAMAVGLAGAGPSFSLAVLRRDGLLLPFASFNGRTWDTPWASSGNELPIGLADVPKKWWGPVGPSAPWTAWMVADGSQRPLQIRRPAQMRVFCGERLGLATDYKGDTVDQREPTVPKDAVAIAAPPGSVNLEPLVNVSVHSPDATKMIETIRHEFDVQESVATQQFTAWQHPYGAFERHFVAIQLEAFYRYREKTPKNEWQTNYVEAIRRFPARPDDRGCGLITWVRGWVFEQAGKNPAVHVRATVTYCDREGVAFMLPLGHLSLDGENYWVYQMSSWRDEIYTVAHVQPDEARPVVAVVGGNCPKRAAK